MSSQGDTAPEKFFDKFWEWRLKDSPEFASYCGNHDYDDKWDDISEEAYLKREDAIKTFLAEAEGLDQSSCSKLMQDNICLFIEDLKTYLAGASHKSYLVPVSYLEGIHNELNHLIDYQRFQSVEDYEKHVKRLKALPQRVLQNIPLMKQGIKEGLVLHKHSMVGVIKQLDTMVTEDADESILIKPFMKPDCTLPDDVREKLKAEAVEEFESNIKASLKQLRDFVEREYMSNTRASEGICTLENGADFYQKCLNFHLSCEMTPREVHDIGLKEVARIQSQMLKIAAEEGFENDLKGFQKKLYTSDEFAFKSEEEVLAFVKDICFNQIRPKLTSILHSLPEVPLQLKPTPASQANSPQGFYSAGTVDKSRPGIYYVNGNKLDACKKFDYMALSLHEGEPGHHLQQCASFSDKQPSFRQYIEDSKYYLPPLRFSLHTAYCEGWGLYCESLGHELGLYTDNYTLFGRYMGEMLRAARLVVDTGLHTMGWTQKRAVQYLMDTTLSDEWSLTNEINRYITWPGQACAYKIGEMKLWELRHKAEKGLGSQFDVRDFHEAVLKCGPVPLTFLESTIDDYIKDTQECQASPAKQIKK